MKWLKASLVGLTIGAIGGACGGASEGPPPDVIQRRTVGPGVVDPVSEKEPVFVPFEPEEIERGDAGCCVVPFALAALEGEVAAELVLPDGRREMSRPDGGAWQVDACLELTSAHFYFQVAVPTDDDAGVLWMDRVNPAVASTDDSPYAERVNLLDVPNGGVCESFDGSPYARLPGDEGVDGGGMDAGSADAGTLPTKTLITAACDTLGSPSVLMDANGLVNQLDEAFTAVTTLPFSLDYFGESATHFAASSNGFLQFFSSAAGTPTQGSVSPIPTSGAPDGVVAPFWDDLTNADTSAIRAETFGTTGARRYTIEWSDWMFYFGSGVERVTFQVKFFEADSAIEFHYCSLEANGASTSYEQGFAASVGLESLDGTRGVQHSHRAAVLTTTQAVRFE